MYVRGYWILWKGIICYRWFLPLHLHLWMAVYVFKRREREKFCYVAPLIQQNMWLVNWHECWFVASVCWRVHVHVMSMDRSYGCPQSSWEKWQACHTCLPVHPSIQPCGMTRLAERFLMNIWLLRSGRNNGPVTWRYTYIPSLTMYCCVCRYRKYNMSPFTL